MKATEVAVFTKRFMDRTAEIMAGRIVLDADDGKFQNNKRRLKYKSAEYKIRKKAGKAGGKGVSTDRNINFVPMGVDCGIFLKGSQDLIKGINK